MPSKGHAVGGGGYFVLVLALSTLAAFYCGWLLRSTVRPAGPIVAYGSLAGYAQQWAAPPDEHSLYYLIPADSIEVLP